MLCCAVHFLHAMTEGPTWTHSYPVHPLFFLLVDRYGIRSLEVLLERLKVRSLIRCIFASHTLKFVQVLELLDNRHDLKELM
jgi:hypothetical protein